MNSPSKSDVEALTKERDAYKKAKQENDDRFMAERDEARIERDEWKKKFEGKSANLNKSTAEREELAEAAAAVVRERDEALAEVALWKKVTGRDDPEALDMELGRAGIDTHLRVLIGMRDAARASETAMRSALAKFGEHLPKCNRSEIDRLFHKGVCGPSDESDCDCGYDAALAPAKVAEDLSKPTERRNVKHTCGKCGADVWLHYASQSPITICQSCAALASPAIAPASGTDAFHAHLDACQRCRDNPMDLCPAGAELLRAAAVPSAGGAERIPNARQMDRGIDGLNLDTIPCRVCGRRILFKGQPERERICVACLDASAGGNKETP